MTVNFSAVAQGVNIRLRGLQIAIYLHTTACFCPCTMRQRGFRAQARRRNNHVHFNAAAAVERGTNAAFGFAQALQLLFQHQMHPHVGQAML